MMLATLKRISGMDGWCWEENIALKKKLCLFHSIFHCLSAFENFEMISMLGKWLSYESAHTGSYFFLKGKLFLTERSPG